jgi:hypothetical protein
LAQKIQKGVEIGSKPANCKAPHHERCPSSFETNW